MAPARRAHTCDRAVGQRVSLPIDLRRRLRIAPCGVKPAETAERYRYRRCKKDGSMSLQHVVPPEKKSHGDRLGFRLDSRSYAELGGIASRKSRCGFAGLCCAASGKRETILQGQNEWASQS
jgi:hypothetical protein